MPTVQLWIADEKYKEIAKQSDREKKTTNEWMQEAIYEKLEKCRNDKLCSVS